MLHLLHSIRSDTHSYSKVALVITLIAGSIYLPGKLTAGTGGVEGGCAFTLNNNGKTTYKACVGADLPMWYSASQNPTYNEGDFPCGTYGNQNCGAESGDPLNE